MKIFITGATGFIGSNLVVKLVALGQDITINLREGKKSPFSKAVNTYYLGKNIESDIDFFKESHFDGVIHLATCYITNHNSNEINELIDSNIKFGSYLLECSVQANIKWFINTGTVWQNFENKEYSPVNLYAATKQAFETIAHYYIETSNLCFVTIKLSDTFGSNDTRPKIFNLWHRIMLTGETIEMSPGEQIIDITHIDNVVHAFILLSNELQNNVSTIKSGDVFTLQSEDRYTLRELSLIYERVMGSKLNIIWGGRAYREREVMKPWSQGKTIPNYSTLTSLEEGLKKLKCL